MRAVLADGEPRVEQVPDPALSEGTVLVRVHLSAITGLDVDVVRSGRLLVGSPGSGFVGTIIDAEGREARRLIGCRVVGRSSYGCGHCDSCRAGAAHRCPDRVRPGHLGASGSHAEKMVLPSRAVLPIPETVSDTAAALLPLLAGIYSGLWRAGLPAWTNILVVGDGGTGLLTALAYASAGYTVTVRGKHGNRFDVCRRHNIHFNLVTDDPEVRGHRPGRFGPALVSYPFIAEATGHPTGWDAALALASPGATIFMLSSCLDGVPRLLSPVQEKNLHIMGLREGPLEPVLQIVASGLFDPSEVVTSTFELDAAAEAYAKAATHREWIPLLRMTN